MRHSRRDPRSRSVPGCNRRSITNGTGDDIASDNAPHDGRNVGRGCTPILKKPLERVTRIAGQHDRPFRLDQFVKGASYRVQLLAHHVRHQQFCLPHRSVWVSCPATPGYSGSFRNSMQQIVSSLKASGKNPLLVKVRFRKADPVALDKRIREVQRRDRRFGYHERHHVHAAKLLRLFQAACRKVGPIRRILIGWVVRQGRICDSTP